MPKRGSREAERERGKKTTPHREILRKRGIADLDPPLRSDRIAWEKKSGSRVKAGWGKDSADGRRGVEVFSVGKRIKVL